MAKKYCKDCQYCIISDGYYYNRNFFPETNDFERPICNRFNRKLTELEIESENDCNEFLLWYNK